jgi:hypothetical protein
MHVSRLGKRTNAQNDLLWKSPQIFVSDDIAQRENGSQGNELGELKVGVLALLKLEVSLPQSDC